VPADDLRQAVESIVVIIEVAVRAESIDRGEIFEVQARDTI
jgi:hypothetical protein